jgi:uncharacterized protein YecT (DUF1311 family)
MKQAIWFLVSLFFLGSAQAATLDCFHASATVEKIICDSPKLLELDGSLNRAYKDALSDIPSDELHGLVKNQKRWLKETRDVCKDEACLIQAYSSRIESIRHMSRTALLHSLKSSSYCTQVHPLYFKGEKITTLCKRDIPKLLEKPLDYQGMMGPLIKLTSTGEIQLTTCSQYIDFVGVGNLGPSRMEAWTEYAAYMNDCGVLFAVSHARKAEKSFLGNDPTSLEMLPPTILPNGSTQDSQDELDKAYADGMTAEDFLHNQQKQYSGFKRNEYLDGWNVILHARADFDGDGIEEALVSYSYSPSDPNVHYFSYGMGILKRDSNRGPAKWINFPDFRWAGAESTNSVKP